MSFKNKLNHFHSHFGEGKSKKIPDMLKLKNWLPTSFQKMLLLFPQTPF